MDQQQATDAEIMQFVMDEQEARWQAVLAANLKPDLVAAHWILIFCPESLADEVMAGLPLGAAIEMAMKRGHKPPPEVMAVHAEWHAKIIAADMERPWRERVTPEGKEAARREAEAWRDAQRKARRKRARQPLPERLQKLVDEGVLMEKTARHLFVDLGHTK